MARSGACRASQQHPAGLPCGRYDLHVMANGIASHEAEVRVV